jgi:hypothetical protein
MKKSTLLLALAVTGLLVSSASAQVYVGSDNFNDNTIGADWDFQNSAPGTTAGTWTETNSRLEYTSSGAPQSRAIVWNNATNTSYNDNWVASVTVTNLAATTSGYNLIGLQLFPANNLSLGYFGLFAYRNSTGTNILFEKASAPGFAPVDFVPTIPETDLTNVFLQISHNATTHDITLAYSQDNGATFIDSAVFNPGTAWSGAPTDGFSFRLLGFSSGDVVAGGTMYADNFSVSAIPEPSTYAAFAGLGALGLAVWRRRQAKKAA